MNFSLKQYIKFGLLLIALVIGVYSLYYTNKLVKKISIEERKKMSQWAEAMKIISNQDFSGDVEDIGFYAKILESNTTIPVILADKEGIITFRNLGKECMTNEKARNKYYERLKQNSTPILIDISDTEQQFVYFDDSEILKQLKIYPYYQLGVVSVFLLISYFAFSYSRRAEENRVWVGLAKETAHQLGTPMSSLMAWVDLMELDREQANETAFSEMRKDLDRLKIITERFSKIGSVPIMAESDIIAIIQHSIEYLKTRTADTVIYNFNPVYKSVIFSLNVPLFEWVIENIVKNAIDAMEGKGEITINCIPKNKKIYIDISDTGKGIPKHLQKRIFNPGFTTKKRGWGLGLSLVKRIIYNYHHGEVFVKESIPNKGTTFRIILPQKQQ